MNTNLLLNVKYHCAADLQFDWFGFGSFAYVILGAPRLSLTKYSRKRFPQVSLKKFQIFFASFENYFVMATSK